ncbi:SHOCT domain-containing protein [Nocardioides bizhenqiangii]|uniref:SHOCT domain-containing protein n=1 Tax=Nocardioides bizhenqiangii TaxID=3095076 RepID=A0ABZ0ZW03_9ACTN|nr:SHOCT domain-containing protein [Nocardioides sp. HM61]WQQ28537.1 SHOCT domain-containing protein [Nocardioides sp. HM61]
MKLAALGVITALIGIVLGAPGLIGIGAFWMLLGPLMRMYGQRIKDLQASTQAEATSEAAAGTTAEEGSAQRRPSIDGRTFAVGTMLWLLLGIPSLAVGILLLGIGGEDENWRWLPIVVGGLALGIGVISAAMYLAGASLQAVAELAPETEVPATLWVKSVRETGTFINERPRLEFELRVEPDGATELPPYDVTKKATVPFTAMGSLRVGDGFRALVAGPDNPTAMEIRWDEPVAGTTTAAAHGEPARVPDVSARLEELDALHRADQITADEYEAQRARILGSI